MTDRYQLPLIHKELSQVLGTQNYSDYAVGSGCHKQPLGQLHLSAFWHHVKVLAPIFLGIPKCQESHDNLGSHFSL